MHNAKHITRRQFLKMAGLGLAAAGLGTACSGRAGTVGTAPEQVRAGAGSGSNTLKIMQWGHFVPAYKAWFEQYIKEWGAENGVQVVVDFVGLGDLHIKAAAQAAAQEGHDLFWFSSSPAAFESELVDLSDVVQEIESQVGPMTNIVKQTTYNAKTGKQFGLSDYWVPGPIIWRQELWAQAQAGAVPNTWDEVLQVGRKLKAMGYPLGIGMSAELDSNMALRALLYSYGASVQDQAGKVVINSPQTVEAVKMGAAIFNETMTSEVLGWASSSNNNFIGSGNGAMVVNAISALRSVEKSNAELAQNLSLAKMPAGPVQRLGPANVVGVYTIWKFSKNIDTAKKFIADLVLSYDVAFVRSELFNFPAFPGTVPNFKQVLASDAAANPPGKYSILEDAEQWSTNFGYPGTDNAAINDVMSAYVVPKMFALAAQGEMTAQEAVTWAEGEINPMFEKWRRRGLI